MKGISFPLAHRILALSVAFLATIAFLILINRPLESEKSENRGYMAVSGGTFQEYAEKWEALYDTPKYVYGKDPAGFLKEHYEKLPLGRVLDIAMGEGRNAVFLAKKGFKVEGVDISSKALAKARRLARENGVSIRTIQSGLKEFALEPESYDVILNINFLMRDLIPTIRTGLKHGGVIVFENATTEQNSLPSAQLAPHDQLLDPGELRKMFEGFEILVYRENVEGKEAKAYLLARKP